MLGLLRRVAALLRHLLLGEPTAGSSDWMRARSDQRASTECNASSRSVVQTNPCPQAESRSLLAASDSFPIPDEVQFRAVDEEGITAPLQPSAISLSETGQNTKELDGGLAEDSVDVEEVAAITTCRPFVEDRWTTTNQEVGVGMASPSFVSHVSARGGDGQPAGNYNPARFIDACPAAVGVEQRQFPDDTGVSADDRYDEELGDRSEVPGEAAHIIQGDEPESPHPIIDYFLGVGGAHFAESNLRVDERFDYVNADVFAYKTADVYVVNTKKYAESYSERDTLALFAGIDEGAEGNDFTEEPLKSAGVPTEDASAGGGDVADEAGEGNWPIGDERLESTTSISDVVVPVDDGGFGNDSEGDTRSEPAVGGDPAKPAATARKPSAYRPRLNRTRERRPLAASPSEAANSQSLEADLQVVFRPGDWGMDVWALLRQPASAADEVAIMHRGESTWLNPLDDQLLEPLALTDAAVAFGERLLITSAELPVRWSRTSRDLHVLAPRPGVAGFVSAARVVIGQENAVICRDGLGSCPMRWCS